MKNCSNCGVSLEEHMNFCPLCGEPAPGDIKQDNDYIRVKQRQRKNKQTSQYQRLSRREKLKLFWEVSGLVLLSGVIITLLIDLTSGFQLSWSKYPAVVGLFLFGCVTLIRFFSRRIYLLISGFFLTLSLMLLLLDSFNASLSWSLSFGIPLLLISSITAIVLKMIIARVRQKGFNLIAYALLAAALLSFFTEMLLSIQSTGGLKLRWSLVVLATILPVAAVLFFFHYRLKKGTNLKRFFHI